jgi:tail tube protein
MGRVLTNNISLAYSIEAVFGVLNTSGEWKLLEPNDITTFGATITTVARSPISKDRQRKKGTVVDLDSAAEFEHDLTKEVFIDFAEGFVFARFTGLANSVIRSGASQQSLAADDDPPPAGTDSGYTHSALSAAYPTGQLMYARGFSNATNNGLKQVITGSTTTSTLISTALVDEVPTLAANATLEVAGFRFGTSEISITVTGTTAVITRIAGTKDFTTLGLTPGQLIHVGGLLLANQFSAGKGYARVVSIPSATVINLDKLSSTLVTDNGTGDTVDLLYGRFLRNVATDHADFLERSYQFEAALPNLGAGATPRYEYSLGNLANTMALSLPLADKATVTFGFVGTDTGVPTATRATNAATPTVVRQSVAFNTSQDILRLRIQKVDETGLTTCFKDVTLTLNNNVSPEKCLGTLGAVFMNTGNFEVDLEGQILFTEEAVASAVRNNETVTMDTLLKNGDGALCIDIPAMTLGGGDKEFPVNESVLMNLTGQAFADPVLGTSIGISIFPVVP